MDTDQAADAVRVVVALHVPADRSIATADALDALSDQHPDAVLTRHGEVHFDHDTTVWCSIDLGEGADAFDTARPATAAGLDLLAVLFTDFAHCYPVLEAPDMLTAAIHADHPGTSVQAAT